MEEGKIVEVEVESASVDAPLKKEKGQRVESDHSRPIFFFGRASMLLFRLAIPLFFISLGMGLAFSILFSEKPDEIWRLVLMAFSWSLTGLSIVGVGLALLFRYVMRSHKRKDPNFEESVNDDYVYE